MIERGILKPVKRDPAMAKTQNPLGCPKGFFIFVFDLAMNLFLWADIWTAGKFEASSRGEIRKLSFIMCRPIYLMRHPSLTLGVA